MGVEALTAVLISYCLLANLFVLKTITLFGLTATAADAFTIGATLALNLIQEYYGKERARLAIWANMLILILYTLVTIIHLAYVPSPTDTANCFYVMLLAPTPADCHFCLTDSLFLCPANRLCIIWIPQSPYPRFMDPRP